MGASGDDEEGVNYIGEYDRFITLLSSVYEQSAVLSHCGWIWGLMEPQVAGRFDSPPANLELSQVERP